MEKEIEKLQELIDSSNRIVFLAVRECPQRAAFRIFEVWTGCIISSMIIRRRRY